jgi:cytochrome bd ubiquinol oxidase subunit I
MTGIEFSGVYLMLPLEHYPVIDLGPLMKGLVIGGLGIFHVFLAQFAIGGGMLLCYLQWLHMRGACRLARRFSDDYFKLLVLVSFVLGAVTGVAMWFTSIQISPRTIGTMVLEFHWVWATEWTFFCLEVVAGYLFYRYGSGLPDRTRLQLLLLYSFASWMSLFWINGILSWQLTPGTWLETRNVWAGFFNPGFLPSLIFRTISAAAIAALAACTLVNAVPGFTREERQSLVGICARPLVFMLAMPLVGAWYLGTMPADSRGWATGGSVPMTLFLTMAVGSSTLIGLYAILAILRQRLFVNGATASLLLALAFVATAGGEFVREGVRKPFTIREYLYSNSIARDGVADLRRRGSTADDPYPLRNQADYPNEQLVLGAKVFRAQCSVCHTLDGMNAVTELAATWTIEQRRLNIAQLQRTKPFMPPFAGTPSEVEAIVQLIGWRHAGRPADWAVSRDPAVLAQIERWLDEAGTGPGDAGLVVDARLP